MRKPVLVDGEKNADQLVYPCKQISVNIFTAY